MEKGQMNAVNKDLVRRYARLLATCDVTQFDDLVTPTFVLENPALERPMSRDDVKNAIEEVRACFDDRAYTVEELIAEGDRVMARYRISGTQRESYQGIPSLGRRFTVAGVSIYRIVEERIAAEWELVDRKGLHEQLRCAT